MLMKNSFFKDKEFKCPAEHQLKTAYDTKIKVEVNMPSDILEVKTATKPVQITQGEHKAHYNVCFDPSNILPLNFTLFIKIAEPNLPKVIQLSIWNLLLCRFFLNMMKTRRLIVSWQTSIQLLTKNKLLSANTTLFLTGIKCCF